MNYFHLTWDECFSEMSFKNLQLLSASIPQYISKEEKEKQEKQSKPIHLVDLFGPMAKVEKNT